MRTTISIDDALLATAKRLAAARGMTLGDFLEEGIRHLIAHEDRRPRKRPSDGLPTGSSGGYMPGFDPTSNRSIWGLIAEEDYERDFARFQRPAP